MRWAAAILLMLVTMTTGAYRNTEAGVSLGLSSAVKEKVKELDTKVRDHKAANAASSLPETPAKFEPAAGKTVLIIGQDKTTIDNYVTDLGVTPAGFMFYTSVQRAEGIDSPSSLYSGVSDFTYTTNKYSQTVVQIGLWMVNGLDGVVNGTYNTNIDKLGEWIRNVQRPVFLRIGYEFDFPDNNYDPAKYINAFRYIVDRYRAKGINNIAYVWHSYASALTRPLTDWYPGDDYVDWFGLSYFTGDNGTYQDQVVALAKGHHKPVMIAEATPYGIGTGGGQSSWDNWFHGFFDFVNANDIEAICYIDCDWETIPQFAGQGWGDARVQADSTVKANWLTVTNQSKYWQSSSTLFSDLGYK